MMNTVRTPSIQYDRQDYEIDLSISIVNYNTSAVLKECISSIVTHTQGILYEMIVVDNGSTDDSCRMIREEFPQIDLIANSENLYFTKANNLALKKSLGRYLMILNPDTFIKNDCFTQLVRFMDSNPKAGACGPILLNPDGTYQSMGHRFPTFTWAVFELLFINTLFPNNPVRKKRVYSGIEEKIQEIDAVGGSCMLVRRETMQEVGCLNEDFLMYFEETDWCRRIWHKGWKIYSVSETSLFHYRSKSSEQVPRKEIDRILRSSLLTYYKKYSSFLSYLLLEVLCLFNSLVLTIIRKWRKWSSRET